MGDEQGIVDTPGYVVNNQMEILHEMYPLSCSVVFNIVRGSA